MNNPLSGRALKERLPRAWPAFFERHGAFTGTQIAAMPLLLDGENVIICAPTASGKTEAVMAPLIERHCRPGAVPKTGPAILYVVPTRALVNDLSARLRGPLGVLRLTLGVRTRDLATFRPERPPAVLLTTPESFDSLLCTQPRAFANLRAVVLDELHLLDGTPRGDHLRALLNRLRRIRAYASMHGDAPDATLQYAALSATLSHPAETAARYFPHARVVDVAGARPLRAEEVALSPEGADELLAYLGSLRPRGWHKALAFCNSRAEVEAYAAAIRDRSPFGAAVYVHYSNIEARRRREIEHSFATDDAAILFATNTLELGIDVGDIDVVLLIGPPGNAASFTQRIGRGNRRGNVTRVACLQRTPLERVLFNALLTVAGKPVTDGDHAPFRPSVAIQQIFSLLKASPTAAVRLAELDALFEGLLAPHEMEEIVGRLYELDYLAPGRPGEWRAGESLNELVDRQASRYVPLSIHSNVKGAESRPIAIRDQHTHEIVATVDRQWLDRRLLTLEGRPVSVSWDDGEALWVTPYRGRDAADRLDYRSTRQLLSYALARLLPEQLGLSPEAAPFIPTGDGTLWFHFLGDVYGRAALDLARYHLAATETTQPGLCLLLPGEPRAPLTWSEGTVRYYLHDNYRRLEPLLDLGPFHHLLPSDLRRRSVIDAFDIPRFVEAVVSLKPLAAPDTLAEDLAWLLPER